MQTLALVWVRPVGAMTVLTSNRQVSRVHHLGVRVGRVRPSFAALPFLQL